MNKTLITRCAGFIGGHLANRLLEEGNETWGIDNLSRPGSLANLEWLKKKHGDNFRFCQGDVADADFLNKVFRDANSFDRIAYQAAQFCQPVTQSFLSHEIEKVHEAGKVDFKSDSSLNNPSNQLFILTELDINYT